jgi:hypothetical protein
MLGTCLPYSAPHRPRRDSSIHSDASGDLPTSQGYLQRVGSMCNRCDRVELSELLDNPTQVGKQGLRPEGMRNAAIRCAILVGMDDDEFRARVAGNAPVMVTIGRIAGAPVTVAGHFEIRGGVVELRGSHQLAGAWHTLATLMAWPAACLVRFEDGERIAWRCLISEVGPTACLLSMTGPPLPAS